MRAGEDGGRDISDTGRTRRKRPGAARAPGTDSAGFDRSLPGPAAGCRLPAGGEPPSAPSPWLSRPRWTPPPSPALNAGPAWAGSLAPLACHFRPSGPLFGVPWTPRFFPNQAVILPASQAGGSLLSPGVGSGSGFQAVPCPRTGCKCWAGGGGGGDTSDDSAPQAPEKSQCTLLGQQAWSSDRAAPHDFEGAQLYRP